MVPERLLQDRETLLLDTTIKKVIQLRRTGLQTHWQVTMAEYPGYALQLYGNLPLLRVTIKGSKPLCFQLLKGRGAMTILMP